MEFVEDPPQFAVKDGNVICTFADRPPMALPLRAFRIAIRRGEKALTDYDAKKAEVVPLRKKRGDHAAS